MYTYIYIYGVEAFSAGAGAGAGAGAADRASEAAGALSPDGAGPAAASPDDGEDDPVIAIGAVGGVPPFVAGGAAAWDQGGQDAADEARALEVQWMGDLIITWVRTASRSLNVWTLAGRQRAHLRTDNPLVQADVL